jgi:putative transcriptional regulator
MAFDEPSRRLIAAYAQGSLDPASALLAQAWMELNPSARTLCRQHDALAGAFLEHARPANVSDALWARVAAGIGQPQDPSASASPGLPEKPAWCPPSLGPYVAMEGSGPVWRQAGLLQLQDLPVSGSARMRLVRMPEGRTFPSHRHEGAEWILVLSGAFSDHRGMFQRGDLSFADKNLEHSQNVPPEAPCICLVAQAGDLTFTGRWAVLMNAAYAFLSR